MGFEGALRVPEGTVLGAGAGPSPERRWALRLELLPGGSLAQLLLTHMYNPHTRVMSTTEALSLALDVARGVAHLHGLSPMIVHRCKRPHISCHVPSATFNTHARRHCLHAHCAICMHLQPTWHTSQLHANLLARHEATLSSHYHGVLHCSAPTDMHCAMPGLLFNLSMLFCSSFALRDLKSENVLLTNAKSSARRVAKLCDLGLHVVGGPEHVWRVAPDAWVEVRM